MFVSVKSIHESLLHDPLLNAVFRLYHNAFNDYGLSNFFYCNKRYINGSGFTRNANRVRAISLFLQSDEDDRVITNWICDEADITIDQLVDAMMVHWGLWGDHGDGWSDV